MLVFDSVFDGFSLGIVALLFFDIDLLCAFERFCWRWFRAGEMVKRSAFGG